MFPGESRLHAGTAAPCPYIRLLFLVGVVILTACRPAQKMADQPKYDPLEASAFFPDGMASRPRVAGTIPYQGWKSDLLLNTGKSNGQLATSFPYPLTAPFVERGEERFNIYCSMCHGRSGYGDGMIVQRGFRKPTSFHSEPLRSQPHGYYFDVITNGFGAMPQYGTMIPVEDRWAIVAYVRALQFSQNATLADLPAAERPLVQGGVAGK